MQIVIPMSGEGSRFKQAGHSTPKPFIPVNGKSMIHRVVDNLQQFDAEFIFLAREDQLTPERKCRLSNTGTLINVDVLTEGAACTVLLARDLINTTEPLLIVNSDQLLSYNHYDFTLLNQTLPGSSFIWVFQAFDPKWSFVNIGPAGNITEVAEKNPISNVATCGWYYWDRGCDFVSAAERMIAANDRVNNEFYVAPVYNHHISSGGKVYPIHAHRMVGLGTPEDLKAYEAEIKAATEKSPEQE